MIDKIDDQIIRILAKNGALLSVILPKKLICQFLPAKLA